MLYTSVVVYICSQVVGASSTRCILFGLVYMLGPENTHRSPGRAGLAPVIGRTYIAKVQRLPRLGLLHRGPRRSAPWRCAVERSDVEWVWVR